MSSEENGTGGEGGEGGRGGSREGSTPSAGGIPGQEMDDFNEFGEAYETEHDVSQQDAGVGGSTGDEDPDFVEALIFGKNKVNLTTPNRGLLPGLLPSFMQPAKPPPEVVSRIDPSWDTAYAVGRGVKAGLGLLSGGLPGIVGAGKTAYEAISQNTPTGATQTGTVTDPSTSPDSPNESFGDEYSNPYYMQSAMNIPLSGQDALDLATPAVTPVSAPEYQYLENWWDGNVFHPAPITRRI